MKAIPFAGSSLEQYRHVCAFFRSADEEYATLMPFICDGIGLGERAFHVLGPAYREEHLDQLRKAGVDVDETQRRGQLEVTTPAETYLRGGHFDKDAMLALIQSALQAGIDLGFPLTRLIAHAETVLGDGPSRSVWVEYEMQLNEVLPRFEDPVICAYDANLLDGALAFDILRTHPVAVIGGQMHINPFFARPSEFLEDIAARRDRPDRAYRI
jgi:hypothetical protein